MSCYFRKYVLYSVGAFFAVQVGCLLRYHYCTELGCSSGTIIVLSWAAPAVLGPNILSKGVDTGLTATQFGPACVQTMSCLPGARLRQAERGVYPLFLPQKELFSSFCCRTDFSPFSAAEETFLQFLPQD